MVLGQRFRGKQNIGAQHRKRVWRGKCILPGAILKHIPQEDGSNLAEELGVNADVFDHSGLNAKFEAL